MIYLVALAVHVVSAILGSGQVLGLAFAAGAAQPDAQLLKVLVSTTRWSLVLVFLSGVAMLAVTGGAYAHETWLRASFVVYVLIGGLIGLMLRALKAQAYPRLRRLAFAASALVAVAATLMETKPSLF
jgi:hypothetical protein